MHDPIKWLKEAMKAAFPRGYDRYLRLQYARVPLMRRIAAILASDAQPIHYDDHFDRLQNSGKQYWPEYGYDSYSTWARGCERAVKLLRISELRKEGLEVFEAGCGDGMTAYVLRSYGNETHVTLNDTVDWRDSRAKSFPFVIGDMCQRLPVDSDSFDLVMTYNTFEHIPDPKAALGELTRVCRKGGYICIDFSPLYCSPLGLHAFSFLMPYPQFLFSSGLIERKVRELRVKDLGQESESIQPTNRWRVAQFRELWRNSGCEIVSMIEDPSARFLSTVIQFPGAFYGRELTVDDLIVSGIAVMLQKN